MKNSISFAAFVSFCFLISSQHAPPARAAQTSSDGGIIIDAPDPEFTQGGDWKEISTFDLVGQSLTSASQTNADGAWSKWTTRLPTAGKYRVYFWHVPCADKTTTIEIQHGGQTEKMTRNVAWGHLGWTSLGDYDFTADADASVKFTRGSGTLIVDSIKFLRVDDVKPIPALPPYPKPDGTFTHLDPVGNLILNGKPYPVIYQELHEETTAHPELIATNFDETFDMALAQGVNTLGTTIYWKTFEATPDDYDFAILDALIEKARARNMHLDLILFFAWRNLQSYYLPPYIVKDRDKYLLDHLADGTEDPHRKVSPFADAVRERETKALTALFQRVLEKDPDHQVVTLTQIENEMPAPRDYSPPAMAAWNSPVPKPLIDALTANEGTINRSVWRAWDKHGHKTDGTWTEVFGEDNTAGRIFGAWCAGGYIQSLVTDLKKTIQIPFYMNAWVGESPCTYQYMDVFHAAAPVLDAMGPDAYGNFDKFESDVGLSVRSWNRLMIPEQSHTAEGLLRAIGNYDAVISGQWHAVEGFDWLDSRETYDLVDSMAQLIASKRGTGDMLGFFQSTHAAGEPWSEYFQNLKVTYIANTPFHILTTKAKKPIPNVGASNLHPGELDGCGLLVALGHDEYLLTSTRIDIALSYINGGPITLSDAQAGHFQEGNWISDHPVTAEQADNAIRFRFPAENRHYGQIRFKLTSTAANPGRVFEAERGSMIKQAEPTYSAAASGAFCVTSMNRPGVGVDIHTNLAEPAEMLTIRYTCKAASAAAISVDGKEAATIDCPPTATTTPWAEQSIALHIPPGAVVSVQSSKGRGAPDLDCIILSKNPPSKS